MASDYLYQQSEKVRKILPLWQTKRWNLALDFVKRGEVERVGERDFRIPFDTQLGGRLGTYNLNMGDMGRGSAPKGNVMIQSFFNLRLNFELPKLAIDATKNKEVSVGQSPFKKATTGAIPEFITYLDKLLHSTGSAALATGATHSLVSGNSQYVLESNFKANRLRRGQYVTVYDTTLATLKATNLYVDRISWPKTVVLSGAVPSAANTDVLCLDGVSGASPTAMRGLYYWIDYATSGTTAGINRATEPEIVTNSVNAAGGITHEHAMLLFHKTFERCGEAAEEALGLCPIAQEAAIYANVMSIQNFDISSWRGDMIDRLPALKGKKFFKFGNNPMYRDIHQDQSRIDYIRPSTWGRSVLNDLDWFELPGSNQRFFHLTGASGAPAAGVWFGFTADYDFYNTAPREQGVIYGLTLGTSYQ